MSLVGPPALATLHQAWHLSVGGHSVPSDFDVTVEYLQALMLLVAIFLSCGFALLVSLALYLCLVISFAQPAAWPSWRFRLVCIAVAVALVVAPARRLLADDVG